MREAYTVAQITTYIKNMFSQDFLLSQVKVKGEVSNCKYHQSGHIYFTLKDDKSTLACVMFASDRTKGLNFKLEDGANIEVSGRIDIFERNGSYQLYAKKISKCGEGALYEKFLLLKAELEERGMFSDYYKQPIPRYINRLGVVTAPTGAAVRDIIQVAKRRNPWIQIILYPALVQGEGAANSIVSGIRKLEEIGVDTIIVGRGGGSIEDLWPFNEEIVAQAIFDCSVPIISAVGHETDFTIADFVADKRAATPSVGAELAVFETERIIEGLDEYRKSLQTAMQLVVKNYRNRIESITHRLEINSPQNQLLQKKNYSMMLEERICNVMTKLITNKRHDLQMYITRMSGLSPLEKLNQGYSVVSGPGGRIHSTKDVNVGDDVKIFVSDGYVEAKVEGIHG